MPDMIVQTTHTSLLQRLTGSVGGAVFGVVLFVASFPVLFLNEGRAVRTHKSLAEGAAVVVSVPAEKPERSNEGRLVHLSGQAALVSPLLDNRLNLQLPVLALKRDAQMFQWQEREESQTKTNLGGSQDKTSTYTYSTAWSADLVNSAKFKDPEGHQNPRVMPVDGHTFTNESARVGGFRVPGSMIAQMSKFEPLPVKQENLARLPEDLRGIVKRDGDSFYFGKDPANPAIGDVRVTLSVIGPQPVSVIARQFGDTLTPYRTKAGGMIAMLRAGEHPPDEMFRAAVQANAMLTWLLRGAGFAMMFIGFTMLFVPLATLASVLPGLDAIAGLGVGLVGTAVASAGSLTTIAIGWLAYRPMIGVPLLVSAIAAVAWLIAHSKKREAAIIEALGASDESGADGMREAA